MALTHHNRVYTMVTGSIFSAHSAATQLQATNSKPNLFDFDDHILGSIVKCLPPTARTSFMATCSEAALRAVASTTHLNKSITLSESFLNSVMAKLDNKSPTVDKILNNDIKDIVPSRIPVQSDSDLQLQHSAQKNQKINDLAWLENFLGSNANVHVKLPRSLTDNQLTTLISHEKFQKIQHLNLRGCNKLTDTGLEHLKVLSQLQHLDLSGCENLTGVGLKVLRKALPITDVVY